MSLILEMNSQPPHPPARPPYDWPPSTCPFIQNLVSLSGFRANGNEGEGPGESAVPRKDSGLAARRELLRREEKEHAWREMEGSQPEPPVEGN